MAVRYRISRRELHRALRAALRSGMLLLVGGVLSAMWVGMFVHAVRAWRDLGFWPSYDRPDPKDLPPWLVAEPIEKIAIACVFVAIASGGVLVLRQIRMPAKRFLGAAAMCAVAILVAVVILMADPGGVLEWYVD